jgi:hypothetical protein
VLAHLKQEGLVHDQNYRGASKDGHRGKAETIVVDLKVGYSAKKKLSCEFERRHCGKEEIVMVDLKESVAAKQGLSW